MILHTTILLLPLLSNICLTWTLSVVTAMATMVVTVVVIMAMTNATRVKTMITPLVAMTMVMSVVVTMSSVFFYRWDCISIRLCICFCGALLWDLSAL